MFRNKLRNAVDKLSHPSFRINAIFLALLWIIYGAASYQLTLRFALGGWSALVTAPASFLFYTIICALVLAKLVLYFLKKNRPITFYPAIFIFLVLIPQILFVLFNTSRDCGDYYCAADPNLVAAIIGGNFGTFLSSFSPFISIFSVVVYVAGLIILFHKLPRGIAHEVFLPLR